MHEPIPYTDPSFQKKAFFRKPVFLDNNLQRRRRFTHKGQRKSSFISSHSIGFKRPYSEDSQKNALKKPFLEKAFFLHNNH